MKTNSLLLSKLTTTPSYSRRISLLLSAVLSACVLSACVTPEGGSANNTTPNANAAFQANFKAASDIALQGKAFAVSARLIPGDNLKVGEALTLQISTARAGRVWVLAVDAADKVDVLFPNAAYRDNAVKADSVSVIPPEGASGRLIAAEPRGDSRILVVVTAPDQTLDDVISSKAGLRYIGKAEDKTWAATLLNFKVQ